MPPRQAQRRAVDLPADYAEVLPRDARVITVRNVSPTRHQSLRIASCSFLCGYEYLPVRPSMRAGADNPTATPRRSACRFFIIIVLYAETLLVLADRSGMT